MESTYQLPPGWDGETLDIDRAVSLLRQCSMTAAANLRKAGAVSIHGAKQTDRRYEPTEEDVKDDGVTIKVGKTWGKVLACPHFTVPAGTTLGDVVTMLLTLNQETSKCEP